MEERNDLFFFFSSRRRHTRSKRDWSSDVCSSDLFLFARGRTKTNPRCRSLRVDAKAGLRGPSSGPDPARSEERRVGKECRSRRAMNREKEKIETKMEKEI